MQKESHLKTEVLDVLAQKRKNQRIKEKTIVNSVAQPYWDVPAFYFF